MMGYTETPRFLRSATSVAAPGARSHRSRTRRILAGRRGRDGLKSAPNRRRGDPM